MQFLTGYALKRELTYRTGFAITKADSWRRSAGLAQNIAYFSRDPGTWSSFSTGIPGYYSALGLRCTLPVTVMITSELRTLYS
jgi:hypothetical protein